MLVELRTITPEMAKAMLQKNTKNRPVRSSQVKRLAQEIIDGRWKVNGDTIRFEEDVLVDGQHRLLAIVKAGKAIETLVVEGLETNVFQTIDIGVKRSPGDTLAVEGCSNSKELATMLTLIERYMTGQCLSKKHYTNAEVLALHKKYPDAKDFMAKCHHGKKLITRSLLMACNYLFAKKDPEKAEWFIKSLVSGKDISDKDAVYLLRERLMRNALSKSKLSTPYVFALVIKAWNADRQGKKVKCLKFCEEGVSGESFPIVF